MARRLINAAPAISKNDNWSGDTKTMYREQNKDIIKVSVMHHIRYRRPERVQYLPGRYSQPRVIDRVYYTDIVMNITDSTAVVLEGGSLRGVFTCGVLDCFMDDGLHFPFTVGVSAGACNGLSYMSGQRGRAKASNIDLMDKYHYVGFRYLLTQRCIMDFKLLFEDFPEKIIVLSQLQRYSIGNIPCFRRRCQNAMQYIIGLWI